MAKAYLFLITVICIVTGVGDAFGGSINFDEVLSFSVPGLGTIQKYDFGDINFDGNPEILASDGDMAVLYSYTLDSVLFEFSLDSLGAQNDWFTYGLVLSDINRDYFPDIIIGGYSTQDLQFPALRLYFYSGTGFWGEPDSLYMEFPSSTSWLVAGDGLDLIDAVDFNNDGYAEFVFSCDSGIGGGQIYPDVLYGITNVYYSFPDSIAFHDNIIHSRPMTLPDPYADFTAMQNRQDSYQELPGYWRISHVNSMHIFENMVDRGLVSSSYSPAPKLPCNEQSISSNFAVAAVGDIDLDVAGVEMIIGRGSNSCCYDGPEPICTSSGGTGLYHFVPPNQVEKLYDILPGSISGSPVYLPQYPGSFFSLSDDSIYQYEGSDGSFIQSSAVSLTGNRKWTDPFDDDDLYLVTTQSNSVTVFAPKVITDADGGETPAPLPTTLSLGKPYPNPFNAEQTIPVTVKTGSHLTVDVYDILGRKIERLFDGVADKSVFNLTWNAGAYATGIYFVRAASENETAVVCSILLK